MAEKKRAKTGPSKLERLEKTVEELRRRMDALDAWARGMADMEESDEDEEGFDDEEPVP